MYIVRMELFVVKACDCADCADCAIALAINPGQNGDRAQFTTLISLDGSLPAVDATWKGPTMELSPMLPLIHRAG